ncbi:MAG: signal recognition particle-docking protein FtsY [bacterium]
MEKNSFLKPRSFLDRLKSIFSSGPAKEHIEDLEEALIEADIDMNIVNELTEALKKEKISSYEAAKNFLKDQFVIKLKEDNSKLLRHRKIIILTGINGAGKTTTASKLAHFYQARGKKVMFVAADTFRAAAIEQLDIWAKKTGTDIVKGLDGGDPAAIVFDGIKKAKKEGHDIVIIDTAGRLHTKVNLMQELLKIKKVVLKEFSEDDIDTLIIIDTNTGKNSFEQAKEFNETLKLTGVILTKFDSSAKGGSIIRIKHELKLPIKYMTFGENVEAIAEFNADEFVEGLFQ